MLALAEPTYAVLDDTNLISIGRPFIASSDLIQRLVCSRTVIFPALA
jgi:hypothetical protein